MRRGRRGVGHCARSGRRQKTHRENHRAALTRTSHVHAWRRIRASRTRDAWSTRFGLKISRAFPLSRRANFTRCRDASCLQLFLSAFFSLSLSRFSPLRSVINVFQCDSVSTSKLVKSHVRKPRETLALDVSLPTVRRNSLRTQITTCVAHGIQCACGLDVAANKPSSDSSRGSLLYVPNKCVSICTTEL